MLLHAAGVLCIAGSSVLHAQEASRAAAPEAPAPEPRFDVWEYRVLGNSSLPGIRLEEAVYPHLGPAKTIEDVEAARKALETAYHEAGYGTVFVDIPEQNTDGGIVRLQVTEGRIDRVRITGARYFANGDIRTAVPELQSGKIPQLPRVQSELNALNAQTGDRVVVPVLKAGRAPGTVDVELKVDDKLPVHVSLEVSDRYSADTSRLRVNGSLSYTNLFERQHTLSLQYQTAPENPDDVTAIVGSYVFRLESLPNTAFALYAVDSETDVATLGTLSVIGNGQIYGTRAIYSLPRGNSWTHNVAFGLDFKDFSENIRLAEDQSVVTPVQYLNWSAVYSFNQFEGEARNAFSVGANFGVADLANDEEEFANKRFKGRPNYFYVRANLERLQPLPWNLQLFGRVAGQFTQTPLVSNEQFSVGGVDTVRGYLESSQLGDYGASGTLELRETSLSSLLRLPAGAAYVAAFYDAAIVQIMAPLPSQQSTFDLHSAGLGVHIEDWAGFSVGLDWANALESAGRIESGEDRFHFAVKYAF